MHDARCERCGRTGRIPDAARRYRCKSCGGSIVAVGAAAASIADPRLAGLLDDMPACPACMALNPADASFCTECGVALTAGSSPPSEQRPTAAGAASPSRGPAAAEASERMDSARAMAHVKRTLKSVQLLFALGSAIYLMQFVILAAALGAASGELPLIAWLALALIGLLSALAGVGAWRILHEPLLWCLSLASMNTLDLAWGLARTSLQGGWTLAGGSLLGGLLLFRMVWAVALWVVVLQVARVRVHILRHPDLWNALRHHTRRKALREQLGGAESVSDRGARRARARRMPAWQLAAASAAVLLATWGVWAYATREPPLEVALTEFRTAWHSSRLDDLTARFSSPNMVDSFERVLHRRGWPGAMPLLGEPRLTTGDQRAEVRFDCDAGELRTSWELRDREWLLTQLRFPEPR